MSDNHKLRLDGTETLTDEEKSALLHLLDSHTITTKLADEALVIHRKNKTPLRDILGAMGHVSQKDYAANLAEVDQTAYVSELIGSEFFDYNPEFVRQFDPAVLVRYLFCPMQNMGDTVVVLAADPNEAEITPLIQAVVPNADIIMMIGTEINVTRLVNEVFAEKLLDKAVNLLRREHGQQSASTVFTRPQMATGVVLLCLLLTGLIWDFWAVLSGFVVVISVVYVASIFYKLILSLASFGDREQRIGDKHIKSLNDAELPI
jgi:hypothetical protein